MPLTQALDENIQQARMGVMTLICTLYIFFAPDLFNSLLSTQMKEVKPLTCLPVPLSAAFNVSGKFQRGQTKINTKHQVPEVAETAQHHACQTEGVYLISHQMRSSLGSLLTRVGQCIVRLYGTMSHNAIVTSLLKKPRKKHTGS